MQHSEETRPMPHLRYASTPPPRVARRPSRHPAVAVLAAVLAAFVAAVTLTACGGTGATVAGETRTVTDVEGTTVTVPAAPQRVVALSEPALDGLLALDVTPVGVVAGRGQRAVSPYLPESARTLPLVGRVGQPNFEAIGTVRPDLILIDGTSVNNNPPIIAQLRQIAPVVYTGYAGGDWRENFRRVADAVNLGDRADGVLGRYDDEARTLAGELGRYADKTFSIVRWQGNSASLILNDLPPGRALKDVGLRRPPAQDRDGRGHSEPVSEENLRDIDADYMFFGTLGGSSVANPDAGGAADVEGARRALEDARSRPAFAALRAVTEDHVIPVDGSSWTSTGGPLLMTSILRDIREDLL
ncbi:iron-siderophore ABC transporter substrate-binding protein [Corynebacterium bovis]|uniref:ABC transporter substrate-binding protein n=1 Tax=Corynebacterium bovis TaxID=36808 RepID=UPI00163A9BF7|nr:iron-siderophore ABC transporter substrate-binding protein [Corynebacterium bovis]